MALTPHRSCADVVSEELSEHASPSSTPPTCRQPFLRSAGPTPSRLGGVRQRWSPQPPAARWRPARADWLWPEPPRDSAATQANMAGRPAGCHRHLLALDRLPAGCRHGRVLRRAVGTRGPGRPGPRARPVVPRPIAAAPSPLALRRAVGLLGRWQPGPCSSSSQVQFDVPPRGCRTGLPGRLLQSVLPPRGSRTVAWFSRTQALLVDLLFVSVERSPVGPAPGRAGQRRSPAVGSPSPPFLGLGP